MNTLEILKEQRKSIEDKVAGLQDELGDIEVAIRAIEGRKGSRLGVNGDAAPKPILAAGMRRAVAPA